MNFFGMGPQEILIILVVALIIFGPGRLPEVAGQVGRAIRDFRRMTSEWQAEFERTTGVQELKRQVESELSGVKSQVASVGTTVQKQVTGAASTVTSAAKSATAGTSTVKPAGTGSATSTTKATGSSTTGAKTTSAAASTPPPRATKKDPLADVSFLDDTPQPAPATSTRPPVAPSHITVSQPSSSPPPSPPSNGSISGTAGITAVPALDPDQLDALARARLRRLSAGYNRRHA